MDHGPGDPLVADDVGLAIGITALGDPRTADSATASSLGLGAGLWGAVSLLIALFLGGLVSTRVTDRPDRGGAVLHGALVWTLTSLMLVWLLGQGVSLGLSGLFGALSGLTRTAATAVTTTATQGGDLAHSLGLTDATQVMNRLDNPETAALFASATGMAPEEARATLGQFRGRIEAVRDHPERVAAEVRDFLTQYKERAAQPGAADGGGGAEGSLRRRLGHVWRADADADRRHRGRPGRGAEPAHLAHTVGPQRGGLAPRVTWRWRPAPRPT